MKHNCVCWWAVV